MSCSCCGNCGCQCGKLPYTMTVVFSGLTTKTAGDYCDLSFSSNFGSGAAGVATAPGGCDGDDDPACEQIGSVCNGEDATYDPSDRGPLTAVLLTNGGSCYAKLGRIAPVLTASVDDGSGATLKITTTETKACDDSCLPYWYVSKITASGGGGYRHNSPVRIAHSVGDTKILVASATLQTAARVEPELTLSAEGGAGAALTPTIVPTAWGIDEISVSSGGSKNTYGQPITIKVGSGDETVEAASAIAVTTLTEPTVKIDAFDGTGATLTPSLTEHTWIDGKKYWKISDIGIGDGGSGYRKGSGLTASTSDSSDSDFCGTVSSVGPKGSITAISICNGGRYYKETGKIESIKVVESGSYYHYTKDNPPTVPTLSASATDGSLSVTLKPVAWGVSEASVDDGGTKYKYNAKVSVSLGSSDVLDSEFSGKAKTTLVAPTLTVAACEKSGRGAVLTPTLQNYTDDDGIPYWAVASIAVTSGGMNYETGDDVLVRVSAGTTRSDSQFSSKVTKTDEDTGAIQAVAVSNGGKFYRDTGVISSVVVNDRGRYYKDTGEPVGVTVQSGGRYYREDKAAPPYVADVKVTACGRSNAVEATAKIDKSSGEVTSVTLGKNCRCFADTPTVSLLGGGGEGAEAEASLDDAGAITQISIINGGTGYTTPPAVDIYGAEVDCNVAEISATVDANVSSDTFGQITKLTVNSGGDCYLAWQWAKTCHDYANDLSLVLRADEPIPLVSLCPTSCFGGGLSVRVTPTGERVEPEVKVTGGGTDGTITATLVQDGEDYLPYWTISGVSASGGSGYQEESAAVVTTGPCATAEEGADITLTATDGVLTGATVNNGGKYYIQRDYDGTPTPIKAVTIDSKGSGYARFGRQEPSITIKATDSSSGSGSSFTPTLKKTTDSCGLDYWYIDSVSVSGGSCYGIKGRTRPTLTATATPGEGAEFEVTPAKATDTCGGDYWRVESISVKGGCGYTNNGGVTITASDGATTRTQAKATIQTKNDAPTLAAKVKAGTFTVGYDSGDPWKVTALTLNEVSPCTRFTNNQPVTFSLGKCDVQTKQAVAVVKTTLKKPTLAVSAAGGTGANLKPSLQQQTDQASGDLYWEVSSFAVDDAGVGYEVGAPVTVLPTRGQAAEGNAFKAAVSSVNQSGGVSTVDISDGGKFFRDTGIYLSAKIIDGGGYYKEGVPTGITVNNSGVYFVKGPDESLDVKLDTSDDKEATKAFLTLQTNDDGEPTGVTVSKVTGSGASIAVEINKSGAVSSLTLQGGGSGYGPAPTLIISGGGGSGAAGTVTATPEGKITQVSLSSGGSDYTSLPTATIVNKGAYYQENKFLTPYVSEVTITVDQAAGSSGSGAEFKATVNQDTKSGEFGQVSKVEVVEPGSGYTLFGGSSECAYSGGCGAECGVVSPANKVRLEFRGTEKEPEITLGDRTFRMTEKVADCRSLPTEATVLHSSSGGSVTLSPGGLWNPTATRCGDCTDGGDGDGPCIECTGTCQCGGDCGSGCGCREGRCVSCCGSCGEDNPCPDGCECVDGECAPEQECPCFEMRIDVSVFFRFVDAPEDLAEKSRTSGSYSGADFDPDGLHWLIEWTIEKASDERWTGNFHHKADVRYDTSPDWVIDVVYKRRPGGCEWYLASFRHRVTALDNERIGDEPGDRQICYCETFTSYDPEEGESSYETDCRPFDELTVPGTHCPNLGNSFEMYACNESGDSEEENPLP